MDKDWVIDQWFQVLLLLMFWSFGTWAWAESGYQPANLVYPACWTLIWAFSQEVKMLTRASRWAWEQSRRDWEMINSKIEWFMRNNITIEFRPVDDDEEEEETPSKIH